MPFTALCCVEVVDHAIHRAPKSAVRRRSLSDTGVLDRILTVAQGPDVEACRGLVARRRHSKRFFGKVHVRPAQRRALGA